jgi:BirA family biotin operon repressor/biotin-[acetyl-CoA-carboxylase] ligase
MQFTMKKFNDMLINIVSSLSDGNCHSGNELGLQLNVSRTAIWKQIKQLIDIGVPIQRIPNRGYRLNCPMQLLDEVAIRQQLGAKNFNHPINFHLFASLDSTNRLLRELPCSPEINICCAEMQTQGRGRFGRHWYSPFGENIYFSSRWHFDCDLSHLSGLSLVVSLAIISMLNEIGIKDDVCVKWPNDILWHDKKLCGNLIEVIAESNSNAEVVIGIGLNVNSTIQAAPTQTSPDKPWCSLYDITGRYINRNELIASLIIHLHNYLDDFIKNGFASFIKKWQQVDYLQGKMINVSHLSGLLNGVANGVNETGQLLLNDEKGLTHCLSSGDTSLHVRR